MTSENAIPPIMRGLTESRTDALIRAYINEDLRQLKWLCDDMTPAEKRGLAATLRGLADRVAPMERT
jgi:hypothetical protein